MARRTALQSNDLGRRIQALNAHDGLGNDRYRIHPECLFGGGSFIAADVVAIAEWSSLTAQGTWAAYNSDGTTGANVPTIASSAASVRTTGMNVTLISWDPNATGQDGQFVEYRFPSSQVALAYMNYLSFRIRNSATLAAAEIQFAFLDAGRNIIGTRQNVAAVNTANAWQVVENDIQALRIPLVTAVPSAPQYLRIYHNGSSGQDATRLFNLLAYDISNGKGPVYGLCVRKQFDAAYARGTFVIAQPGFEHEGTTAASNSRGGYGPIVEGQSAVTAGTNVSFNAPASAGDTGWVQVSGDIFARVAAAVTPISDDPVSFVTATTVDDEEAVGQGFARFLEDAIAGQDAAIRLDAGMVSVAFGNVLRDNVANTVEPAFSITGEIGSGAGAGADFPITGGTGGATGAGGAITLLGGTGGATSGAGGAATLTAGNAAAGNSLGGNAALTAGNGSGTQPGGTAIVTAGTGGATGAGGAASLIGGTGGATSGAGGAVNVTAGNATAGNSAGGQLNLTAGNGSGTTAGGAIVLTSGTGANGTGATAGSNGGNISITGGAPGTADTGTAGSGGALTISAAAGANATGAGGDGGTGGSLAIGSGAGGNPGAGGSSGPGGSFAITSGAGGTADTTTAGAAGPITVTGGAGGAASGAAGIGGAGAAITITLGAGGVSSNAASGNGGDAGDFAINPAAGGTCVTGTAGDGSSVTFACGAGGAASGAAAIGGAGGILTVTAGAGGATTNAAGGVETGGAGGGLTATLGAGGNINAASTGTAGAGGAASIATGAAGTIGAGGTGASGGALTITLGASSGTVNGAIAAITAGNSGSGATGDGGAMNLTGGAAASTNGAGGAITTRGGLGTGTGAGGASQVIGGVSGATGTGGAAILTGGASAGGGGTAGPVQIDAGAPGAGAANTVQIGATNASAIVAGRASGSPIRLPQRSTAGQTAFESAATSNTGFALKVADLTITLNPAAASHALFTIPDNAAILAVQAINVTAITGAGGAAAVGIGTAGDPDKYALIGDLLINTQRQGMGSLPDAAFKPNAPATTEALVISACTVGGAPLGTIGGVGEQVRVVIHYFEVMPL